MKKERPILMCGEMVRATFDGRKTQTRRLIKPQPEKVRDGWYADRYNKTDDWTFWGPRGSVDSGKCHLPMFKCPHGKPGDLLWVKEMFYCDDYRYPEIPADERADSDWKNRMLYFRADGEDLCQQIPECECEGGKSAPWKPSIFMPRWASRITLEIVSVRVERLQDITESDAKAEGVEPHPPSVIDDRIYRRPFNVIWDSINAKTHPWASNPWVWVLEFNKLNRI